MRGTGGTLIWVRKSHRDRGQPPPQLRGLPLIHDKTVDEWGTADSWSFHGRATCPFGNVTPVSLCFWAYYLPAGGMLNSSENEKSIDGGIRERSSPFAGLAAISHCCQAAKPE